MADAQYAIQQFGRAVRRTSMYADPVNRHRDEYLAGEIDVEEFERRIEATLNEQQRDTR